MSGKKRGEKVTLGILWNYVGSQPSQRRHF
jgi:hypothetical protein